MVTLAAVNRQLQVRVLLGELKIKNKKEKLKMEQIGECIECEET